MEVTRYSPPSPSNFGAIVMLNWIIIFLAVSLIAGFLGFGGVAGASASIAQALFFIFLVGLIVTVVMHLLRGRSP